jgi:hypothetical protein
MERLRDRSAADEGYAHGIGANAVEQGRSDMGVAVFLKGFIAI